MDEVTPDHEALLRFLYVAPVGLLEASMDGEILMINAASARLLMPLSRDANLDNLFAALHDVVPDLRHRVATFEGVHGTICEALRFAVPTPGGPRVVSLTLLKIDGRRLMAVVGDVADAVSRERRPHDEAALDPMLPGAIDDATNRLAGTGGGRPEPENVSGDSPVMTVEPVDSAYETLVQFLYRAPVGLVQTTLDGTVEMMNPMSASLLMGASPDGDLDNLFDALAVLAPDLRVRVEAFPAISGVVCDAMRLVVPANAARETAQQVLSISLSKLDGTRLMAMVDDVTTEVHREQSGLAFHLNAAARVDRLTQLPNRAVACERIDRAIARAAIDPAYGFAVLFLNCDRFKQINDTLGHVAGDAVLVGISDRLQSSLRRHLAGPCAAVEGTMVARLGGDEFAVCIDHVGSCCDIEVAVERLLDDLAQPYVVDRHHVHSTVSIGVVPHALAVDDADVALRDASIAMVEAKRAGGGRQVWFEAAMQERARMLAGIEIDLRRALTTGELFVVYQPVVALRSGDHGDADFATSGLSFAARSAGIEALVRWRHPVRGLVSPVDFIGVAERCGLIGALGAFVLASACRQFAQWQRTLGERAPRLLAVNVSRGQLVEPGFADYVAEVLRSTGMAAAQLQLEITESLAAQDEAIRQRLHELKALGLTLALDDFGTGYSSLASLHELPVDTVKIDRSFVDEAVSSTYHRVLIEATVRVASSLRMNTVAEGIETEAQAALVRELGCDKGQGYLFSKPLGAVEFERWLRDG